MAARVTVIVLVVLAVLVLLAGVVAVIMFLGDLHIIWWEDGSATVFSHYLPDFHGFCLPWGECAK